MSAEEKPMNNEKLSALRAITSTLAGNFEVDAAAETILNYVTKFGCPPMFNAIVNAWTQDDADQIMVALHRYRTHDRYARQSDAWASEAFLTNHK